MTRPRSRQSREEMFELLVEGRQRSRKRLLRFAGSGLGIGLHHL